MNVWKLNKENKELKNQIAKLEDCLKRETNKRKSLTELYRFELKKKEWEIEKLKNSIPTCDLA